MNRRETLKLMGGMAAAGIAGQDGKPAMPAAATPPINLSVSRLFIVSSSVRPFFGARLVLQIGRAHV